MGFLSSSYSDSSHIFLPFFRIFLLISAIKQQLQNLVAAADHDE